MNEPGASVVHHPAETELFADTLTCDVALPASFDAGNTPIHPGTAEMLLRSVALAICELTRAWLSHCSLAAATNMYQPTSAPML